MELSDFNRDIENSHTIEMYRDDRLLTKAYGFGSVQVTQSYISIYRGLSRFPQIIYVDILTIKKIGSDEYACITPSGVIKLKCFHAPLSCSRREIDKLYFASSKHYKRFNNLMILDLENLSIAKEEWYNLRHNKFINNFLVSFNSKKNITLYYKCDKNKLTSLGLWDYDSNIPITKLYKINSPFLLTD